MSCDNLMIFLIDCVLLYDVDFTTQDAKGHTLQAQVPWNLKRGSVLNHVSIIQAPPREITGESLFISGPIQTLTQELDHYRVKWRTYSTVLESAAW